MNAAVKKTVTEALFPFPELNIFRRAVMIIFAGILLSGCKTTEDFYDHAIHGENSSPERTRIEAYQGANARSAIVNNKSYVIRFTTDMPAEKFDSIVGTAEGHQRKAVYNVTVNEDKQLEFNLVPVIIPKKYFTLHGEESTPGASGTAWDGGVALVSLSTNGDGDYATEERELPADQRLDSVTVTAPVMNRLVLKNVGVNEGANKLELILSQTTYDHWFSNTASTPGTHADWYKGGIIIMSADVDTNGDYLTNTWTTTNSTEAVDSVIAKKAGYDKRKLTNLQALTGNNDLQLNLDQTVYAYRLVGSNTTPDGTIVAVWENGSNIANATVNGTSYTTNDWTSTLANMNIDSITFKKTGYNTQKLTNNAVVPGSNTRNAQLTQITYAYRLVGSNTTPDGTAVAVWENGSNIASATVNGTSYTTNDWTSTLANMNIDSITFKKTGYNTQKLTNNAVVPGSNTRNAQLTQITYAYWLSGSNTTPDGTAVAVWENGSNIASATVVGTAYNTNQWTSTLANMTIDSITFKKAGYVTQKLTDNAVVPGNNTRNAQLSPAAYSFSITFNLISSEASEGHKVRDSPIVFSNSQGTRTLNTVNQTVTHIWQGPQATENVTYDVNPVGTGHQDLPGMQTSITGNKTVNETLTANDFTASITYHVTEDGTGTDIAGANVSTSQSKSGTTNTSGNVTLINYVMDENTYSEAQSTTINHTMSKDGYETKNGSASINTGANNVEETLENIVNSFNISGRGHLIGAIVSGLPNEAMDFLKTGSIRFTTKSDMAAHDLPINSQGYFNGDINGAYSTADSIIITYVNNPLVTTNTFSFLDADKVASIGKIKNDNGTYVASANEPRFVAYTARTTIGKLTGKNLLFVAFSDQAYTLPDDLMNIRGGPNHGIISYVEPDIIFVNDTINLSTGLPITQQQRQEQQAAIDFLAEQLMTRTGITLCYHSKKFGNNDFSDLRKNGYIYKADGQAGNGKFYETPTTFWGSSAHTRPTEGYNLIVLEGGTAQLCIYDLIEGSNGNGFVGDENNQVTGLSWIGDVASKTAYLFPEAFFKKKE